MAGQFRLLVVFELDFSAVSPNGKVRIKIQQTPLSFFQAFITLNWGDINDTFRESEFDPPFTIRGFAFDFKHDFNGGVGGLNDFSCGYLFDWLERESFGEIKSGNYAVNWTI